jgi:hypothetical protein
LSMGLVRVSWYEVVAVRRATNGRGYLFEFAKARIPVFSFRPSKNSMSMHLKSTYVSLKRTNRLFAFLLLIRLQQALYSNTSDSQLLWEAAVRVAIVGKT